MRVCIDAILTNKELNAFKKWKTVYNTETKEFEAFDTMLNFLKVNKLGSYYDMCSFVDDELSEERYANVAYFVADETHNKYILYGVRKLETETYFGHKTRLSGGYNAQYCTATSTYCDWTIKSISKTRNLVLMKTYSVDKESCILRS